MVSIHKLLAAILVASTLWFASTASAAEVLLEKGKSLEQVERAATYLVTPRGVEIDLGEAMRAYREGRFMAEMEVDNDGALQDWRTWVALPFVAPDSKDGEPLRRVIGLGGIFVELPRVHLACDGGNPREILASESLPGGALRARYFTYVRTQSFDVEPGQSCLALINAASNDNPNIGIFREGELGSRQVVAVILKSGLTVTLLLVGLMLTVVSYLSNRPLIMMMGITYFIVMLQNEASLFSTTFAASPAQGRAIWETLTIFAVFACYWTFLYGFRKEFRLTKERAWRIPVIALPLPLILVAYLSDSTPDLIWAFYLGLFLYAATVALKFDVARRLRWTAGAVLMASAVAAVVVEPYYLGRYLTDLTIEFTRDAVRLFAGAGMLILLLVDVVRRRRDHDRLTSERIEALEAQAESNRKLLEAEREYARAREAASRTKARLASASHDIRQPIAGLRRALDSEADNLSPEFFGQARQVVTYLERLTAEYSASEDTHLPSGQDESQPYPMDIALRAVEAMFEGEILERGIEYRVGKSDCHTSIPALALIRTASNLVANALQHSQASRIDVFVEEGEDPALVVRDNGRGISAMDLEKFSQRGVKGETSTGDGLGLAIVRELAHRHGFRFTMSSREGGGTTARIFLEEARAQIEESPS